MSIPFSRLRLAAHLMRSVSNAADSSKEICARDSRKRLARDELGRRGGHPRPDSTAEICVDSLTCLGRPSVGLEPLEVEPESARPLPQMGVIEVSLVLEQRVVHLPEPALEARR